MGEMALPNNKRKLNQRKLLLLIFSLTVKIRKIKGTKLVQDKNLVETKREMKIYLRNKIPMLIQEKEVQEFNTHQYQAKEVQLKINKLNSKEVLRSNLADFVEGMMRVLMKNLLIFIIGKNVQC
jgi:hypothetical protein